jgi:chromosome segregation ATPase
MIRDESNVSYDDVTKMRAQKAFKLNPQLEKLINGQIDTDKFIEETEKVINEIKLNLVDVERQHTALSQTVFKHCVSNEDFKKHFDDIEKQCTEMGKKSDDILAKLNEVEQALNYFQEEHNALNDDYKQLKNALTSVSTKQVTIGERKVLFKKKEPTK